MWDDPTSGGAFGSGGVFVDDRPRLSPQSHAPGMPPRPLFSQPQRQEALAPFVFSPPEWAYRDPEGLIQGPFTSEQMQGWFAEGYLPPNLPIKRVEDTNFITLLHLTEKFGAISPFMEAMIEQEYLERALHAQIGNRRTQPPQFPRQPNMKMALHQNTQPPAQFPAFGGVPDSERAALFGNASATAPKKFSEIAAQEQGSASNFLDHGRDEPSQTDRPVMTQMKATAGPAMRKPVQQSPKLEAGQPASPVKATSSVKAPAAIPVNYKKAAKELPLPTPVEIPADQVLEAVRNTSPQWANAAGAFAKISLREIQEKELEEHNVKAAVESAKANRDIIREAQNIAQMGKTAAAPILAGKSTWASTSTISSNVTKLAEILEEETRQKNAAGARQDAGKKYSDTIGAKPPSAWGPPTRPNVVANGPVHRPQVVAKVPSHMQPASKSVTNVQPARPVPVHDDGWNRVGKTNKPTTNAIAANRNSQTQGKPSGRVSPPAIIAHGASPALIDWCKAALAGVQAESSEIDSKTPLILVDVFIGILLSVPVREAATIALVCIEALGGYSAIHHKKFADAFISRRRADLAGGPSAWSQSLENLVITPQASNSAGWATVHHKHPAAANISNVIESLASDNKFVQVVGKNKKKKGKK